MKSNTDRKQERESRNAARLEEDKLSSVTGGTGAVGKIDMSRQSLSSLQNADLETLMMSLQHERTNEIETQLVQQGKQIRERNDLMENAYAMLEKAYECKNTLLNDEATSDMPDQMIAFYKEYNIDYDHTGNDNKHNKEQWDKNMNNLKGFIEQLNSSSQLDMVKLQGMISKRNEAFESTTNMMGKFSKTMDTIVGNMR
jgi:glycerol-3-phosphate cytidylyltransferase-like family protein